MTETGANFKFRLTSEEDARLTIRAAAAGLSRSEFVRELTVAQVIPTRIFNRTGERLVAFRLAQIFDKLDALEAAANAYLTEPRAASFAARLDQIRADVRRIAAAERIS